MDIVDAHHHLWDLKRIRYPWLIDPTTEQIFGNFDPIRCDYLVTDYLRDIAGTGVTKSVHVQAGPDPRDFVAETAWLQELGERSQTGGFPHAIVASADLTADDTEDALRRQSAFSRVRGVRQILNYHADPRLTYTSENLLDDPHFERGYACLEKFGFSFDLQCYCEQMEAAAALAARYPATPVILNHAGMPAERDADGIARWRQGIRCLAAQPNVAVKLSGLGMCDPHWSVDSLRMFVLESVEAFGPARCMFGSNFPVDRLFSACEVLLDAYFDILSELNDTERAAVFRTTAESWYRLN